MVWHCFVMLVILFQLMGLSPRAWLHLRQVTRALAMVSVPPFAYGVMWSGSGLVGWSVVPHARVHPQSGQLVCPAALARWRTRVRHFLWRVVPVRDAVMGSSLARVGGLVCVKCRFEGVILLIHLNMVAQNEPCTPPPSPKAENTGLSTRRAPSWTARSG